MARKKKTLKKKEPTGPQEYKKWKVGDYVYCNRFPDDKFSYGQITNIHLEDASGMPCFTFICDMVGQYRLALFENIIDDPSAKMKNAKARALKRKTKK